MRYDFTTVLDRKGQDALAVDACGRPGGFSPDAPKAGFDFIPMWVADMNFPVLPAITEAIRQRLEHPAFGYFMPRKAYFDSIIRWQQRQNAVEGLEEKHIGYENGVLGGVASALYAFSAPGESILVHSPVYIGFSHTLEDSGRKLLPSPLVQDEQGIWRMDYADMEKKLREKAVHLAILCSPHNPTGRVWERWELEKAMALFEKYSVTVISDEIWSDILMPGFRHIPTQSLSEDAKKRTVALYAPSKTFNLAGLIGSYHIVYDDCLRDRLRQQAAGCHYNSMNVLSQHALIGAYGEEGSLWVEELCKTIQGNVDYAWDFIKAHFPGVTLSKPQGTYMLFLDCEGWCKKQHISLGTLMKQGWDVGVGWQDGRPFGGEYTLRVNLALPLSRVQEAFDRLKKYVFTEER